MPPQELAFAAPGTEEMMGVAVVGGSAGITGVVEGVVVKMAPQMGAAAPVLTWGTTLGVPLGGALGALFTRGLISEAFKGIAAGGLAMLGFTLPEMLMPGEERGRTREQVGQGRDVKLLGRGAADAAQRAQEAAAKAAIGSWAYTPESAKGFVGRGHTVRDYA